MLALVFDARYRNFPNAALLFPALFYLYRPVATPRREATLLAVLIAAVEGREVPQHSKLPVELKVRSSTAPPRRGQL